LCALILAIALGGCALVQPGTPLATWEPLPTIDGVTLVVVVEASPTAEPPATPQDTATVAAISTLAPTTPVQPTASPRPSATPTRTRTASPTAATTSAPTATASPSPTNSATPSPAASLTATRVATQRPRPPAATRQPSELVEGWVGIVTALPAGSAYDDYFACESPAGQYGIDSLVPAIANQLAAYRASACRIRVWGVLDFGVADHGGTRITVTRLEIADP
jgi:hypothetical protein